MSGKRNDNVERESISYLGLSQKPRTKPLEDLLAKNAKNQLKFDEKVTNLGMWIIGVYIVFISISFLGNIFGLCTECYPELLRKYEALVLIIVGFFFGTRLVTQYIPLK